MFRDMTALFPVILCCHTLYDLELLHVDIESCPFPIWSDHFSFFRDYTGLGHGICCSRKFHMVRLHCVYVLDGAEFRCR